MAYNIEQINTLEQFGELTTTFVIVDNDGIMPEVRVDKFFSKKNNIPEIIENEKQIEILRATNNYIRKQQEIIETNEILNWWDRLSDEERNALIYAYYLLDNSLSGDKELLAKYMYDKYQKNK